MTIDERTNGLHAFATAVAEQAGSALEPRLARLVARLRSPVRVAVVGRCGVGRRTVSEALRRRGVTLARDGTRADARLLVIADGIKPEDRATLAVGPPTLIVLNKADLTGTVGGGAIAGARTRAAEICALTGVPTVWLVGLLAGVPDEPVDSELVGALRTMVTVPADLTSVDAFTDAEHVVGRGVRQRLIAGLDRFGIALAVVAIARGAQPAVLPALLHAASNVDGVLAELDRLAAPIRYGRIRSAQAELRTLAVQFGNAEASEILAMLASDRTLLAVMTAAVEVIEATGLAVDTRDDAAAHLRRAVRWRRYGCGPVDELHRNCSADIVRGSLRLLDGASP